MTLRPFCIDRTEVTVAAYRVCVEAGTAAGGCEVPRVYNATSRAFNATPERSDVFCNWGRAGRDQHPINCVSATQAERFCAWRYPHGGRLPTEDEWEFAAAGTAGRRYPWGDSPAPTPQNTNLCGSECVSYVDTVGHPRWGWIRPWTDQWETTASVDALPAAGNTPEGLVGMGDNVNEWTHTNRGRYTARAGNATEYSSQQNDRVLRGGAWCGIDASFVVRVHRRGSDSGSSACAGFRCVGVVR